jgi:GYF domain 2/zinc-ribbon domain
MKFLCRNCKAKYQIADEKVAGRTLRMTCQQCGEPIVVRSQPRTAAGSRPVATMGGTGGGGGGTAAQSALGADFQRQITGTTRDVPVQTSADEWHVAINDVPVGPMRREEVARKIAVNAVDRDSLAWREGMDDWQPIRHIPELAALVAMAPPAPAPVNAGTGRGVTVAQSVAPPPPPPARLDMAPIGSRQVMSLDEYSAPLDGTAAAAMAVPVQQLAPEIAAPSKPPGWGPMFLLVSGGAFILAAGALLGARVLAPQPAPAPAAVVAPAPVEAPKPVAPAAPVEEPKPSNVIELDMQAIDGQNSGARRSGAAAAQGGSANGTDKKKELTAEQKEMLARMGGGLDQAGLNLKSLDEAARPKAGGQGQLTAEQLNAVVLRGRKNLQRCYETALRGSQSTETVRLDVNIEVSPNGNVTTVKSSGKGLPGMDECITRTVKMWRFPSSGDVSEMRFPVVFQPGAG